MRSSLQSLDCGASNEAAGLVRRPRRCRCRAGCGSEYGEPPPGADDVVVILARSGGRIGWARTSRPGPANAWPSKRRTGGWRRVRGWQTTARPWPMNWCKLEGEGSFRRRRAATVAATASGVHASCSRLTSGAAPVASVKAGRTASGERAGAGDGASGRLSSGSTPNSPSDQRARG